MGLTDDFATTRSNIIDMDPLPSLNKVYSMSLRHEKQAAISANKATMHPSDSVAFCVQQGDSAGRASETLVARSSEPFPESFAGNVRK